MECSDKIGFIIVEYLLTTLVHSEKLEAIEYQFVKNIGSALSVTLWVLNIVFHKYIMKISGVRSAKGNITDQILPYRYTVVRSTYTREIFFLRTTYIFISNIMFLWLFSLLYCYSFPTLRVLEFI